jgi:hypothetical protein
VLAALRNRVFFTLDEANAAIRELVAAVNARPLTINRTLTRCRLFEEQEKPLLKPLPAEPFVIGPATSDYHVSIEGVAYSVPYRLIGRHVDVFCTWSASSTRGRGPCPPGCRTGPGDGDARRTSAAQSSRRGASDPGDNPGRGCRPRWRPRAAG